MWGCGAGEARFAGSEEVVGSNPTSSTIFIFGSLSTKMESYPVEQTDYQIALDRMLDKDDEIISGSELRKRPGI